MFGTLKTLTRWGEQPALPRSSSYSSMEWLFSCFRKNRVHPYCPSSAAQPDRIRSPHEQRQIVAKAVGQYIAGELGWSAVCELRRANPLGEIEHCQSDLTPGSYPCLSTLIALLELDNPQEKYADFCNEPIQVKTTHKNISRDNVTVSKVTTSAPKLPDGNCVYHSNDLSLNSF